MLDLDFHTYLTIGDFINRLLSSIYVFFASDFYTVSNFLFDGIPLYVTTLLEDTGYGVTGFYNITMPSIPFFDWLSQTAFRPLFNALFFNANTAHLPFAMSLLITCGNIIFVLFIGDFFVKLIHFITSLFGKLPT